jgi:hypothetical protein
LGKECSTHGEKRNAYRILMGKLEGKRPLGIHRCRWKDIREIGWSGTEWIDLAQDRDQWRTHVNTVMNRRFRKTLGKS